MNRSHKQQLEKLKSQSEYSNDDLEIANELLKQDDPAFHQEVEAAKDKIKHILNEENSKSFSTNK